MIIVMNKEDISFPLYSFIEFTSVFYHEGFFSFFLKDNEHIFHDISFSFLFFSFLFFSFCLLDFDGDGFLGEADLGEAVRHLTHDLLSAEEYNTIVSKVR